MFLDDFLNEELELVLSVLVRAGLWMSHVDDVGTTDRDDRKELFALRNVLKQISKENTKAPFVSELAAQALAHEKNWTRWSKGDTDDLFLTDAHKALQMVKGRLPEQQARNYAQAVFHIANAVAHAYDEHIMDGDDLQEEIFLGGFMTRLMDRLDSRIDMHNPENVSLAEKTALQKLKSALKL